MVNMLKMMGGGGRNPRSYWVSARLSCKQIRQGGEC